MDLFGGFLRNLGNTLLSGSFVYSPIYLLSSLAVVILVWKLRGSPGKFWAYVFPKELYQHPSSRVDLKVAVFNYLFAATGLFSALYIMPTVAYGMLSFLMTLFDLAKTDTTVVRGLACAAILFLTQDFCRYLAHYWHHESRLLWPFHALHHSAEVLTPITYMRAHPVYHIIQKLLIYALTGVAQALALVFVIGQTDFWIFQATSIAFYVYATMGIHLRHSHISLSYGRVLEHILISPAQHHIHHSIDPRHHNKNYGEIFAIWDWMFGTLYIPEGSEELAFGVSDAKGRRLPQPHPTLRAALIRPFTDSYKAFCKRLRPKRAQQAPHDATSEA